MRRLPERQREGKRFCGLQLREVKSFKHISIKPQLACSFNCRLFWFGLYITAYSTALKRTVKRVNLRKSFLLLCSRKVPMLPGVTQHPIKTTYQYAQYFLWPARYVWYPCAILAARCKRKCCTVVVFLLECDFGSRWFHLVTHGCFYAPVRALDCA